MRERLRLAGCRLGEAFFQHRSDSRVQLSAPAPRKTAVGDIPDQCVLEDVAGGGGLVVAEYQFRVGQSVEGVAQLVIAEVGHGGQEIVAEFPADYRSDRATT